VDTAKFCQVAVRGLVRSPHAKRGSNDDWDLQYAFPFRYTVYDGEGRVIHQQEKDFASDAGGHTSKDSRITDEGGSAHIEQGYDKFQVAAAGTIRVEASLGDDADYRAISPAPRSWSTTTSPSTPRGRHRGRPAGGRRWHHHARLHPADHRGGPGWWPMTLGARILGAVLSTSAAPAMAGESEPSRAAAAAR
jgi:hypothetical protein